jgi:hypothetical protein
MRAVSAASPTSLRRDVLLAALVAASAAAAAALAWACGGDQFVAGNEDGGGESVSADQACGDNAHDRCTRLQECSAEQMVVDYGTEGACETRLKLNCLNAISAPSSGNTAARSEACAQAYASESCTDLLDEKPPAACVQATGLLADGEPCAFPGQCQTGFCAIVPGAGCGTCAAAPVAGASCTTLTTCGQVLTCISSVATCSGFALQGGPCSKSALCGTGLFCVGSTTTTPGTCEPSVEDAGAPCDPSAKNGPGCDRQQSLTCSSLSKSCVPLPPYAAAGQPCGTIDGVAVVCGGAAACTATAADAGLDASADASPPTSICVGPAADGAECNVITGPGCLSPARCIAADGGASGTCQFPNADLCP